MDLKSLRTIFFFLAPTIPSYQGRVDTAYYMKTEKVLSLQVLNGLYKFLNSSNFIFKLYISCWPMYLSISCWPEELSFSCWPSNGNSFLSIDHWNLSISRKPMTLVTFCWPMRNFYLLLANENFLKGVKKQGQTRPLDTPKRMIERRERQGEREKER